MNGAPTGKGGWWGHRLGSALPPLLLAASLAIVVTGLATVPVHAQSSPRPSITVAATITGEAAGQTAFLIGVGPATAIPRNSFVRVRGLPPMVALSEGHSVAPGAWAISLAALPNLKMMLPPGAPGRSELVISLVSVDGSVLAETKSILTIAAQPADATRAARDAGPPANASILRAGTPLQTPTDEPPAKAQAAPSSLTPQDRERALRLMQKAQVHLQDGVVSPARLLFERAAEMGLPEAAMALAGTYDQAEIARLKLSGAVADPKEARRWYERARQLGAKGAEERLRLIGAQSGTN